MGIEAKRVYDGCRLVERERERGRGRRERKEGGYRKGRRIWFGRTLKAERID